MDITDSYDAIAAGRDPELSDEDLRWVRKPIYEKALREVDAPDVIRRLAALRVARWIGLERAIGVPAKLVRDPSRGVRVSAFNLAVAAHDEGRPLLRETLLGSDPELLAASLDLLGRLHDQSTLGAARRMASHEDPRVRAAAVLVVGLVGGASAQLALKERPDDAPGVTAAKARAHRWIAGDEPRPAPSPWWVDGGYQADDVAVGEDAEPVHTFQLPDADSPTAAPPPADAPEPEPEASAPAESTSLVPATPTDLEAPTAEPTPGSSGLPDPLPDEPRALAKLYGMVSDSDRGPVLAQLRDADPAALAKVWMGWSKGGDAAVGRGIALAAAHLGRTAFLSKARSLMAADAPTVRSAAVEAMGALGGMSTLTAIRPMLADPEPQVRLAAVHALQALATRTGRESVAQGWTQQLADDDAPEVAAAVAEWAPA